MPFYVPAGFTILEIAVAIALLAVIGILVTQLVAATGYATRASNRGIDAASQARLAFDRLRLDFSARVKRADVDFVVSNSLTAGPPYSLLFLSEVTSATPQGVSFTNNRGVSVVGYQIDRATNAARQGLLRAGKALVWNDTGWTGYQTNGLPASLPNLPVTLSASDFDVLSPAVIRAAIAFQLRPDGDVVTLADGTVLPRALGQIVYSPPVRLDSNGNPSLLVDPNRIGALIVGLVAMNPDSLTQLTDAQIAELAGAFSTPPNGTLPVAAWASVAENVAGLPQSIPLAARQSLRVFQRAFPIATTP